MKNRKTYGINGLLEWHGIVEANGIKMKVDFTNGSVTAFGVSPATFVTSNDLTQHIIENSEQYRKGRIRCVMSVAIPEPSDGAKEEAKAEEKPAADEPLQTVKVSCLDDAKDYLVDHFGAAPSKLRYRKNIDDTARANGIVFEYAE